MFMIVIDDRIGASDQTKDERGGEGERREEEHLERRHAEAGRFDEVDHAAVLHAGVHDQHPQIADRDREIPEGHDRALHRERRLAVGELESGRRDEHLAEREEAHRAAPAT